MDQTTLIAVVTAAAGTLGGLTTGMLGIAASRGQQRRAAAMEERAWRRELAERDRERLYGVAEEIVGVQRELYDRTLELTRVPVPQTHDQQQDVLDLANDLAHLCSRATLLGAVDVGSNPLARVVREVRVRLRDSTPFTDDERSDFSRQFNDEAGAHRARLAQNLTRLRT